MTDDLTTAPTPVVVSAQAGPIDAIQAALRYIVVLVAAFTAIAGFVKVRDFAGFVAYVQANGGQIVAAISGLIAIGTAAYGIFKTGKRGAQVATVAAHPSVPTSVAHLK